MKAIQAHRGPDDDGSYIDHDLSVALGASRLAITDVEGGAQPMATPDKQTIVMLNGEIFNAPELRQQLESLGETFTSHHSDTELLLLLYRRWGARIVERLNGMFAFAILDKRRQQLLLARDRFGIKPLYVHWSGDRMAFASELKALMVVPWVDKQLDLQAIYDYFSFQSIPQNRSPFLHIKKLPQASILTLDLRSKTVVQHTYWTPPQPAPAEETHPTDLFEMLRAAVARWSRSDFPLSLSLSGGLDSAGLALAASVNGTPLSTFTLGFVDHPSLDERQSARELAQFLGTDHHEVILKPDEFCEDLDDLVWHLDEPYGGGLPSWFIYKQTSESHKVMLTGTGADELVGHYSKWRVFVDSPGNPDRLGADYHPMYFHAGEKRLLFNKDALAVTGETSEEYLDQLWLNLEEHRDPVGRLSVLDLQHQLPNEFLLMTDRFSMAHSIEARTPYLDSELSDWLLRLPPRIRINPDNPKGLLRSALSRIPDYLLNTPKRGFVLPVLSWLSGPLLNEFESLSSPDWLRSQGLFSPDIRELVSPPSDPNDGHQIQRAWTFFMFQKWYSAYVL